MEENFKMEAEFNQLDKFEDDSISFLDISFILAENIKTIVFIPLIFSILALIHIFFFTEPIFTSVSKIMSSSSSSSMSEAQGLAAQFGINMASGSQGGEHKWAYPAIIKSRTVARKVLRNKFDTNEFGKNKSLTQILTFGNEKQLYQMDTLETMAVDIFLEEVNVSEDMNTGIYTLSVNSSEPKLAYEINKALINELEVFQKEYNKSQRSDARKFIEERINETKLELQKIEDKLKNFLDRNRRIENSPALQLEQQRLSREVTVLTGVFTTLRQQLETTKIEEVKESNYVIIIDPPEKPLIRSKPSKKRILFIYIIFGLIIGIVVGFLTYFFKSTYENEREKFQKIIDVLTENFIDIKSIGLFRKKK